MSGKLINLETWSDIQDPYIYFLLHHKEIVYVGQTIRWLSRVGSHSHSKIFNSIYLMPIPEKNLNDVEAELIVLLNPKYNKSLPCNKRYKSRWKKTLGKRYSKQVSKIAHKSIAYNNGSVTYYDIEQLQDRKAEMELRNTHEN